MQGGGDRPLGDRGLALWLERPASQRKLCSGKLLAQTQRLMSIKFTGPAVKTGCFPTADGWLLVYEVDECSEAC